jgi:phenol 2-monooxygenase
MLRIEEDPMMQFYLNGYKTGDPLIEDPDPAVAERPGGLPRRPTS